MKPRTKLLSVTINDCEVQTFRAGGPGGQNQNKRDTAVRIIHHPSGARAESREARTQWENKKLAWKKLAKDPRFTVWVNKVVFKLESPEEKVEKDMDPKNLSIETYDGEKWVIQ